MRDFMIEWNKSQSERAKLQGAYGVIAIGLLVIAGLTGLINDGIGQNLLVAAFAFTVIFFINAIGWVLLEAFVLRQLPKPTRKK